MIGPHQIDSCGALVVHFCLLVSAETAYHRLEDGPFPDNAVAMEDVQSCAVPASLSSRVEDYQSCAALPQLAGGAIRSQFSALREQQLSQRHCAVLTTHRGGSIRQSSRRRVFPIDQAVNLNRREGHAQKFFNFPGAR